MASRSLWFRVIPVVLAGGVLNAGGWAVVALLDLPDQVVAGSPVTLTYAVRQHGRSLLGGLTGEVEARAEATIVRADATAASDVGHYSATITLPYPAVWTIDINSGFLANAGTSRITLQAIAPGVPAPFLSDFERGQRLFAAKGCVTCHLHSAVKAGGLVVRVGPALTGKRYQPEYLKQFLANPSQTRSIESGTWRMPDLKLRDHEIAALVSFINAPERGESSSTASRRWIGLFAAVAKKMTERFHVGLDIRLVVTRTHGHLLFDGPFRLLPL